MKLLSISIIAMLFATGMYAQNTYSSNNGTAIKGYDPVAYFLQQKAMKGSSKFSFDWSGSNWKFISQANLDSFKTAPQKYAPQYGGYCAFGVSENHKAPTDPNAWTLVGDKLYLNYNLQVKEMWLKDTANKIKLANENWPMLNK